MPGRRLVFEIVIVLALGPPFLCVRYEVDGVVLIEFLGVLVSRLRTKT